MKNAISALLAAVVLSHAAHAQEPGPARVETLIQSTTSWDGATLPAYPSGQPEITILRITVPPGLKLPVHRHPVINAGVVLAGQLTVVTEANETIRLKAGDPIIEIVDKWHYGKNEGSEPVDIIVFYAGVAGEANTINR